MNKERIIIYGGAFDPFHLGHLHLGQEAKKSVKASKVLYIPDKNPPWKDAKVSYKERLHLLELGLKGQKDLIPLDLEDEEERNYTYLTLRKLIKIYPLEQYELYFLIGEDQAEALDKWKNLEEITKEVTFLIYPRGSQREIKSIPYKGKFLYLPEEKLIDVSSTSVREGQNFHVPYEVYEEMVRNDLYFMKKAHAFYKETRYQHALRVALLSYQIADDNGLDPYEALMAGYYHDITKKGESPLLHEKVKKEYSYLFPEGEMPDWAYHQFSAPYLLKEEFGVQDELVLNAIKVHTTGSGKMSWLAKILYAADKIEPGRGYDSEFMIRAMKEDYNKGFILVLDENRKYLEKNGKSMVLDQWTKDCYSTYLGGI